MSSISMIFSSKNKREKIMIMKPTYKTLTESFNRCLVLLLLHIYFILLCAIAQVILSKSLRYPCSGKHTPGADQKDCRLPEKD